MMLWLSAIVTSNILLGCVPYSSTGDALAVCLCHLVVSRLAVCLMLLLVYTPNSL